MIPFDGKTALPMRTMIKKTTCRFSVWFSVYDRVFRFMILKQHVVETIFNVHAQKQNNNKNLEWLTTVFWKYSHHRWHWCHSSSIKCHIQNTKRARERKKDRKRKGTWNERTSTSNKTHYPEARNDCKSNHHAFISTTKIPHREKINSNTHIYCRTKYSMLHLDICT